MQFEFTAFPRGTEGRGASRRRLRRTGRAPGIVYGGADKPEPIELDHNALIHALNKEAFHSSILTMKLGEAAQRVLLRDVQMHPFRHEVLHIDFQRVDENRKIHMKVPLHFINAELAPGQDDRRHHQPRADRSSTSLACPRTCPHSSKSTCRHSRSGNRYTYRISSCLQGVTAVTRRARAPSWRRPSCRASSSRSRKWRRRRRSGARRSSAGEGAKHRDKAAEKSGEKPAEKGADKAPAKKDDKK
jgi:large subunit ribosomal protein L25